MVGEDARPTTGTLVISLDLELNWGAGRRNRWIDDNRDEVLGIRRAVSRMLDLLSEYDVRASWPVVGLLFCESKDELLDHLPRRLPSYDNPAHSPYAHVARIGESEADDPLHYAPTLIDEIAGHPGQEVASRTFSNFDWRCPGPDADEFAADLESAIAIARRRELILRSLAVPGNRLSSEALGICRRLGIAAVRGPPPVWPYRSDADDEELFRFWLRRWARRLDAVVPLTGTRCVGDRPLRRKTPVEISSTRRWRPLSPRPALLALQRRRLDMELDRAADEGGVVHLWAKMCDFSRSWTKLSDEFRRFIEHFSEHRRQKKMVSATMHDVVMGGRRQDPGTPGPRVAL